MGRLLVRPTDAPPIAHAEAGPDGGVPAEAPSTTASAGPAGRGAVAGPGPVAAGPADPAPGRIAAAALAATPERLSVPDGGETAEPFPPPEDLPRHVAVIMDGNRRWARERGLGELDGHAAGVESVRRIITHAVRRGIPILSLYAFSRENWARSDDEVAGLFNLLEAAIRDETAELRERGVRVRILGRLHELPAETQRSIAAALAATDEGDRLLLNVAFNYAGRTELVDAFRALAAAGVAPDAIDEAAIAGALYTAGQPDPDLVIRTGGEQRLSNFLIWQSAYAEFHTSPLLWPDFGPAAFDEAIIEYARRTRRFGR